MDSGPPPRGQRLSECAARYARLRGLAAADFTLAKSSRGKPYFPHCPGIHFSLSHSGAYWAAAFGGQPLGLDIQRHTKRDILALAQRWYHPEEYLAVQRQGAELFFAIWSAKESLVKCSGTGFSAAFSAFSVLEKGRLAQQCGGWQLKPLRIVEGYSACLCGQELGSIHIEHCNIDVTSMFDIETLT
jgi:4'-phosphopantetheinyl transferase